MLIEEIVIKLCEHYGVQPDTIAKKKHGSTPEFTYKEVIRRLVSNPTLGLLDSFPEIGRTTSTALMRTLFKDKPVGRDLWGTYLLGLLELKKCPSCDSIKPHQEYPKYSASTSGLRNICKICHNANNKNAYDTDPSYYNKYSKEYYVSNKETIAERTKEYYQEHKAEYAARGIKYHTRRDQATVKWSNTAEMNKIYNLCPIGYHVDHIIPIQGDSVCGLHTEHNLQYLLAADNISKSNKFNQDIYVHIITYVPPYENIH